MMGRWHGPFADAFCVPCGKSAGYIAALYEVSFGHVCRGRKSCFPLAGMARRVPFRITGTRGACRAGVDDAKRAALSDYFLKGH